MKTRPPKGFRTPAERKQVAVDVCMMIDAAINQQGNLPQRWERNEQLYRGQPVHTGTEIGDTTRSVPTVGPRLRQVVANVTNPLFSVEPYFAARGYGQRTGQLAKMCEKNVHFFAQRSQLDRRVKKALIIAAKADPAIIKVHFENGGGQEEQQSDTQSAEKQACVGPTYTVIHPKNFAIYPLYTGRIEEAAFVGHRFSKRAQDIREMQARGVYLETAEDFSNDDVQQYDAGREQSWSLTDESSGILGDGNEQVEIWEGVIKKDFNGDGFEEYYLVQVAKTNQVLLLAEPYGTTKTESKGVMLDGQPSMVANEMGEMEWESEDVTEFVPYTRPGYFEVSFSEPDDDEFYRSNPIAQNLQECALTINELVNLYIDGSLMTALPAGFSNSPQLQEALLNYKAGTVNYCDDPVNISWVQPKFDPAGIPDMIEYFEKKADAAVTLSQAGQGQESQGDTTATEYSGILQGQRVGLDDTRATICTFLAPMMDFTRELLYANWETVLENYEEEIPYPDAECMEHGYTWEPMVKGGTNTPQEVTMQLNTFMGFLQSMGVPMTPDLIMECINVFMGALDLPTDMEKLKQAAVQSFIQQQQMMSTQQGVEDAYMQGQVDELTNGRGDSGPSQVSGIPASANPMAGGQGGATELPGFLQQLAGQGSLPQTG